MSGQVKGRVNEVPSFTTKTGKQAFSVVVDGKKYSAGFDKPKCNPGDIVEFTIEMNGQYANVAKHSLRVLPPDAAAPSSNVVPMRAGGGYDTRQDVISRQAATNTALEFLRLADSVGALPFAKTAKAEEKLTALEALTAQYTAHFYETNTGVVFKDISPSAAEALEEAAKADASGW